MKPLLPGEMADSKGGTKTDSIHTHDFGPLLNILLNLRSKDSMTLSKRTSRAPLLQPSLDTRAGRSLGTGMVPIPESQRGRQKVAFIFQEFVQEGWGGDA